MLLCSKLQGLFFVWNKEHRQKITIDELRLTIFFNGKKLAYFAN